MPEDVDRCVQSIMDDNPEMDESTAFAICNDMKNRGVLEAFNDAEPNAALHALAQFRNPGDIQRVEQGGGVLYKRVMLLAPGAWTDAGSRSTAVWTGDAIRRSADNWVDPDTLSPIDEIPLNLLHGPRLHDDPTMDDIGHIPRESIIVDDEDRMYGDLFLHGDTPASELATLSFDKALESEGRQGLDGPSVETVKERSAMDDELGVRRVQEIWFSGVGLVYDPAAKPVDMRNQIRERAVAMAEDAGLSEAGVYVQARPAAQSLKARLRQRWFMGTESGDLDIDDLSDDDLKRALGAMASDMAEIRAALQEFDEDDLAVAEGLIGQFEQAGGDLGAPVTELIAFAQENTDVDPSGLQGLMDAYLEASGAESLDETPVSGLLEFVQSQADGEPDGEEEMNPEDAPELSAEDLEAAKRTIAEFNEQIQDVKDMLTEYKAGVEETVTESIEEFERRLTELEEESVPRALVQDKDGEFYTSVEDEDGEYVPAGPSGI